MSFEAPTQQVTQDRPWDLFDSATTRVLEQHPVEGHSSLMQRAGIASAKLALALAPHARCIWIACGPGNNGGDGFQAAAALAAYGKTVVVTKVPDDTSYSKDAQLALQAARISGARFAEQPPDAFDLGIDAMFGIGTSRPMAAPYDRWASVLNEGSQMTLALDVPSGLHPDTGSAQQVRVRAQHTLCLLTLKPGLFTGYGRDAAGTVWFNSLGIAPGMAPSAQLAGPPPLPLRPHASHKGTYGDVLVIGGASGMTGAALLAADAALHCGAGRVYLHLLGGGLSGIDPSRPELMLRDYNSLPLNSMTCVVGCGGGSDVAQALPSLLQKAPRLVLDADALNAIGADAALRSMARIRPPQSTVMTPHPLEAARLLQCNVAQVRTDRFTAAQTLADQFNAVVLLKGSGTVIASPGRSPQIIPTGNARLATAGTGDVLAGMVGALWNVSPSALSATTTAAFRHGQLADQWPAGDTLTAGALARAV